MQRCGSMQPRGRKDGRCGRSGRRWESVRRRSIGTFATRTPSSKRWSMRRKDDVDGVSATLRGAEDAARASRRVIVTRHPMAGPPPTLADELKSLRIDREPVRRGLPEWVTPAIIVAALVVLALFGWRAFGDRLFAPQLDVSTVSLVTPTQGAQILVATGYVVPQRKA